MIGGRGSKTGTPVTDRERQQRKEAAEARWQGHSAKPASNQIDHANVVKPQDVPARFIPSGDRAAGEGIDVNVPYGTNFDDAIANRDARALVKAQRQRVLDIIRKKQYALRHWYSQRQLRERYGVPENPWLRNKSAIERTVVAMSKTIKADQLDPATRRKVSSLGGQAKARKYYRGGGQGSMPEGKSVWDVMQYEREELGNTETVHPEVDEELLKYVPAKKTQWVTLTVRGARQYGDSSPVVFKKPFHLVRDADEGVIVAEEDDVNEARRALEYARAKQEGEKRFGTKPPLNEQLRRAHEIGRRYTQR